MGMTFLHYWIMASLRRRRYYISLFCVYISIKNTCCSHFRSPVITLFQRWNIVAPFGANATMTMHLMKNELIFAFHLVPLNITWNSIASCTIEWNESRRNKILYSYTFLFFISNREQKLFSTTISKLLSFGFDQKILQDITNYLKIIIFNSENIYTVCIIDNNVFKIYSNLTWN